MFTEEVKTVDVRSAVGKERLDRIDEEVFHVFSRITDNDSLSSFDDNETRIHTRHAS